MTYTVYFAKKFYSGSLKGLTVDGQTVTFATESAAQRFFAFAESGKMQKDCCTNNKFKYLEVRYGPTPESK